MVALYREISSFREYMRRGAGGRGAMLDIQFPSGREQRFPCQDQITRLFNGIKGRQCSILELIRANERVIH